MKFLFRSHPLVSTLAMLLGCYAAPRIQAATPAAILTQPVDQTVVELLPASFSVVATGSPPARLQWFRNNQALPKATNTTYTLPATALTDDGAIFRVEASNVVANVLQLAVSGDAVLHVTADTTGPLLLSGTTLSSTLVQLIFNEGIWPQSASSPAQFTVTGPDGDLAVSALHVVGNRILLNTAPVQFGSSYTVKVQGVKDVRRRTTRSCRAPRCSFKR